MTAVAHKPPAPSAVWSAMPGWGIVGDLTPPEVVGARRLRSLRRVIAIVLLVVVVLIACWYAWALHENSDAGDAASTASDQTAALTREQNKYGGVTRIQQATSKVQAQLATAMLSDSDAASFMAKMAAALPATMRIQTFSISYNQVGAKLDSAGGLDTSGKPIIASVTLSGSQHSVDDTATFADRLAAVPGFVNVLPLSNSDNDHVFNISFNVNSTLLSKQYQVGKTGGPR